MMFCKNIGKMEKERFHLGQKLVYDGKNAVVDALTQTAVGLCVGSRYEVVGWETLALLVSYVGK